MPSRVSSGAVWPVPGSAVRSRTASAGPVSRGPFAEALSLSVIPGASVPDVLGSGAVTVEADWRDDDAACEPRDAAPAGPAYRAAYSPLSWEISSRLRSLSRIRCA
ncbi:hypothetical protein ACE1SV_68790 [Streptomyces sp. E-15]